MQTVKNFGLATQGIFTVLLFSIAFEVSGAEQMMHALTGTASVPVAKPVAAAPALQPGSPPIATPPSRVISAPLLLPEIVAGSGIQIGGVSVSFASATPVNIRSTVMMSAPASPSVCRFLGKFEFKEYRQWCCSDV